MKTFSRFQRDLQEAIPLAIGAGLALPMIGAGVKLVQGYLQAKKQGEGGRSQPVDYGQGGETAKPRTPNVQRGRLDPSEVYRRRRAELNRQDAQARAQERSEKNIDDLIGSSEARAEAARARANQPQIQRQLRQQSMRDRMSQAADRLGL